MRIKFIQYSKYLFLLVCVTPSWANIYQKQDIAGNVYFSDTPSAGATPVILKEINTYASISASTNNTAKTLKETDDTVKSIYKSISILQPSNQQTFQNQSSIKSVLTIEPSLQSEDRVEWMLDGKLYQRSRQSEITLSEIDRGEHTLQAKVVDSNNKPQLSSQVITFYVHRTAQEVRD